MKKQPRIKILEVGLRDGLQNETTHFSVSDRLFMLKSMISAGLTHIEIGAFVSPQAVPQMRLTKKLAQKIKTLNIPKNVELSALVPNEYGFFTALECGLKNIAVLASVTESFSQKNTNCSIRENLTKIKNIGIQSRRHKVRIRGYLSMAFGCPYEGKVPIKRVQSLAQKLMDLGVEELALSDTIGIAGPQLIHRTLENISIPVSQLSLHCHNTRGMALSNILQGFYSGVRHFDSSIGGLGGCPYAENSSGNIATEDLIVLLEGLNQKTKINVSKLTSLSRWLKTKKRVQLSSHIAKLSKNFLVH